MLKNIEFSKALELAALVTYQPGQIVSRTLVQNKGVGLTLFAFDAGEQISSHESSGDAMVYVIEGNAKITIDGKEYFPKAGQTIVMPAGIAHAVQAVDQFKMLLIVVFPEKTHTIQTLSGKKA